MINIKSTKYFEFSYTNLHYSAIRRKKRFYAMPGIQKTFKTRLPSPAQSPEPHTHTIYHGKHTCAHVSNSLTKKEMKQMPLPLVVISLVMTRGLLHTLSHEPTQNHSPKTKNYTVS